MSLQEAIRFLHQKGWGQRRISRELGVHRKTVWLHIKAGPKWTTNSTAGSEGDKGDRHGGGVVVEAKSRRQSACEPFRAFVEARVEAGLSAQCVYQDLVSEHGFKDSCPSFLIRYQNDYQPRHGPLRPTIPQVIDKLLYCGTLERGCARIRFDRCGLNALLAFSCKFRWLCTSCYQKNVHTCAEFLVSRVLAAVPHRHYVLALPRMLRAYLQRHRPLLKHLCTVAHQSLTLCLRSTLGQSQAHPTLILTPHTFGEYPDFHSHIHALVADGLFTQDRLFHPLPELPIKPLAEILRAHVIQLLVEIDLLPHNRVRLLHSWKHSGFNVHQGESIPPENKGVLEQLVQCILLNPCSVAKMTLQSGGEKVICRSKLNPNINRKYEILKGPEFLATITQHIADKGAPRDTVAVKRGTGNVHVNISGGSLSQAIIQTATLTQAVVFQVPAPNPRRLTRRFDRL